MYYPPVRFVPPTLVGRVPHRLGDRGRGLSQPWGRAHARRGWSRGAPRWLQPRHLSAAHL